MTAILTEHTLADLLEDAASRDADLVEVHLLTGWTGTDEELAAAWAEFTYRRDIRDLVVTGSLDPAEFWPELTCADRHQECMTRACAEADEARAALQFATSAGGLKCH